MLLFKKKFIEPIRLGIKIQTIRLSRHRRFRAGQRSYIPGAGYILIESVEEIALESLTDADARPDGFETADLLRAEIRSLYAGKVTENQAGDLKVFKIVFQLLPPEEQLRIAEEKRLRKLTATPGISPPPQAAEWFEQTMQKLQSLAQESSPSLVKPGKKKKRSAKRTAKKKTTKKIVTKNTQKTRRADSSIDATPS